MRTPCVTILSKQDLFYTVVDNKIVKIQQITRPTKLQLNILIEHWITRTIKLGNNNYVYELSYDCKKLLYRVIQQDCKNIIS